MKYKYLTILLLVSIILVFAHQPRLAYNENLTIDNAKRIENPEISQAFYGELKGQPDYYKIDSDKDFNLYVNLVVPDIQGALKIFQLILKLTIQLSCLMQNQRNGIYSLRNLPETIILTDRNTKQKL